MAARGECFGVRFFVRWTTLLYMFGSYRGVSGASYGGKGLVSPFLVYTPLSIGGGFLGDLTSRFLFTWNNDVVWMLV